MTPSAAGAQPPNDAPDEAEFFDLAYAEGWTDGLPVVPPTGERVSRMLAEAGMEPGVVLGALPPSMAPVRSESLAANAVMAGCRPEYFPTIVAAVQALLSEEFNLAAVQPTTNPVGPAIVVNGPVRERLGMNCGSGSMGPGNRANATIGRAVRLALINVGGATPGTVDRATQGFPGKYSFTFPENEAESPWDPLHVRRGYRGDESAVTVFQACGFVNVLDQSSSDAGELMTTIAGTMALMGSNNTMTGMGQVLLVLGPKHASILAAQGLDPQRLREELYERTAIPLAHIPPAFREFICRRRQIDPDTATHAYIGRSPDDIEIAVSGGAGNHSVYLPSFADGETTTAKVTNAGD